MTELRVVARGFCGLLGGVAGVGGRGCDPAEDGHAGAFAIVVRKCLSLAGFLVAATPIIAVRFRKYAHGAVRGQFCRLGGGVAWQASLVAVDEGRVPEFLTGRVDKDGLVRAARLPTDRGSIASHDCFDFPFLAVAANNDACVQKWLGVLLAHISKAVSRCSDRQPGC